MDDELTDYEKLIEGVSKVARLMRAFYSALIEENFTEAQATTLTIEYLRGILELSKSKPPS